MQAILTVNKLVDYNGITLLIKLTLITVMTSKLNGCPVICSCINTVVDCRRQELDSVPTDIPFNATVLYLSYNNIVTCNESSFNGLSNLKFLDISWNEIDVIEDRSFAKLNNLETLILSNNRIFYTVPATYEGLWNLKYLYFRENFYQFDAPYFPEVGNLTKLTILDLSHCLFTKALFPSNYSLIRNLHTLLLDGNEFGSITAKGFENLRCDHIAIFSCQRCRLYNIEKGVLQRFIKLEELYLAGNYFEISDLIGVTSSLSSAPILTKLDISELGNVESLSSQMFEPLTNCKLKILLLIAAIQSTSLQENTFISLRGLEILDLRYCVITTIEDGAFAGLDSLKTLYLGNSTIGYPWKPSIKLFPPNVRELNLDNIEVIGVYPFWNLNQLIKLSLRKSTHFPLNNTSFSPRNSLLHLDLTSSTLMDLPYEPFAMFPKLKILDMSSCKLSLETHLFHKLNNLETLSLADCNIHQVEQGLFRDQVKLHTLDLSKNFIISWSDSLFLPLSGLQQLYLGQNQIKTLNESFFKMWKRLEIDLNSNPFNCSCEMMWFRRLIEPSKLDPVIKFLNTDKYACTSPVEYDGHRLVDVVINDMDRKCQIFPWYITIIVVINSVALLVFIIFIVCYKYRWYVKWYCYKIFMTSSQKILIRGVSSESGYNIYISSAPEDSEWVEELITKFEIQSSPSTNTDAPSVGYNAMGNIDEFNHDSTDSSDMRIFILPSSRPAINYSRPIYYEKRDALPHLSQIGQMGEAIFNSRNAVVAVSLSYLNNAKHQFELDLIQQAMVERYGNFANSHIILVTLEKSNNITSLLPRHLRKHFETTALTWNCEDQVLQRQFWTEFNKKFE